MKIFPLALAAVAAFSSSVYANQAGTPKSFSWSGLYAGSQGFYWMNDLKLQPGGAVASAVISAADSEPSQGLPFTLGSYVGYNVQLGKGLVLGFETDLTLDKPHLAANVQHSYTKTIDPTKSTREQLIAFAKEFGLKENEAIGDAGIQNAQAGFAKEVIVQDETIRIDNPSQARKTVGRKGVGSSSMIAEIRPNWSGATRVRVGYGVGRILPYIAGGVAYSTASVNYSHQQQVAIVRGEPEAGYKFAEEYDRIPSSHVQGLGNDRVEKFLGFTVGTGVDVALLPNLVLRGEYRYTDVSNSAVPVFKFDTNNELVGDKQAVHLRSQDVRLGVAFKF